MAANINTPGRFSRLQSDGAIAIETLLTNESAGILQVAIRVLQGRLHIGGGELNLPTVPGFLIGPSEPVLVLDFTTLNPANGELFLQAEGNEAACIFYVYSYGA